jgi:MFS transporter, DHA1 family, inner membrane transport protein
LSFPPVRRAYLIHAMGITGVFALIPYLAPYLVNNRGVAETDLGWFYLAGGMGTFAVMLLLGRLTDRFGAFRVYSVVAFFFVLNVQLFLWAPLEGMALVVPFTLFMMLSAGRMVPMQTIYSQVAPLSVRAAFMSFLSTVQHMASGLGALLAGVFLTLDAQGRLQNFPYVAEVTVVLTLLVVVLLRGLRVVEDGENGDRHMVKDAGAVEP